MVNAVLKRRRSKIAIVIIALLFSCAAFSKTRKKAPNPRKWAQKVLANTPEEIKQSFVRNVSFVQRFTKKGVPIFRMFSVRKFNRHGFLKTINGIDAKLTFLLNDFDAVEKGQKPLNVNMKNLMTLTSSDVMVLSPSKGDEWKIFVDRKGQARAIATVEAPEEKDDKSLFNWMYDAFGYHGVVLDIRGKYILVATRYSKFSPKTQALVLKKSYKKAVFPKEKHKGSAIIEHVKSSGPYAIFRIVMHQGSPDDVRPGSKVLIESQ